MVDAVLQLVDAVVGLADAVGGLDVAGDEGVEGVAEHGAGAGGHLRDVDQRLDQRLARHHLHDRADALGVVAHALEVDVDRERGDDHAQVDGHRRLLREQHERLLVDLVARAVDLVVVADHGVGERRVAADECLQRPLDLAVHHRAHLQDAVLELVEVGVELFARHVPQVIPNRRTAARAAPAAASGAYPKRPVMYCSVRSSCGLRKIWSVSAYSTRRPTRSSPASMKAVRWETRAACCMLCVTTTIV